MTLSLLVEYKRTLITNNHMLSVYHIHHKVTLSGIVALFTPSESEKDQRIYQQYDVKAIKYLHSIGLEMTLQFISRALDISLISLVWKLGQLINSDISRGQTDICCCYLPELPPLTQTGLVPK